MQYRLDVTKYVDMLWEEVLSKKERVMDWDRNDYKNEGSVCLSVDCHICRDCHNIYVDYEDFKAWDYGNGKLVQEAFPYLTPGQRELIISRTCDSCWKEMFGGDEDEE